MLIQATAEAASESSKTKTVDEVLEEIESYRPSRAKGIGQKNSKSKTSSKSSKAYTKSGSQENFNYEIAPPEEALQDDREGEQKETVDASI